MISTGPERDATIVPRGTQLASGSKPSMLSVEEARAKVIEVITARKPSCTPKTESIEFAQDPSRALGPHSRRKCCCRPELSSLQSFDSRWFRSARLRRHRAGREAAADRRKPRGGGL